MAIRGLLVLLLMLAACERERPPRLPPRDGGSLPLADSGPIIRRDGGPRDSGVEDASSDAGEDAGRRDGGPSPIVIDGVIGAFEWSGARVFTSSTVAVGTNYDGDALRSLYVLRDDTSLFVAIAGTLSSGNAFLAYVDRDLESGAGITTGLLDDGIGDLDRALTKQSLSFGLLRLDAAWGTLDLDRVGTPGDDRMGWRDIGTNPSVYTPLVGASACGASACETQIALDELGTGPADTIAIFVRLGLATADDLSNQTLPMDDPLDSFVVSTWVEVPPL